MFVSGFTIIRNGVFYGYPFKEAILSILPLCDEFIVNVGDSQDETLQIVKSINDKKLKIIESKWDMNLKNGLVLSVETNRALSQCKGDWCFYIQSDEVLHEKYYDEVKASMLKYKDNSKTDGLRFWYKHFYGSYDYYQDNYRKWYIREVRIIKRKENIVSWGDALDFKYLNGKNINSKDINAEIYHYGWVRPPETLIKKRRDFELLYNTEEEVKDKINRLTNYDELGHLKKFNETHPQVMTEIIKQSNWNFDPKLSRQKNEILRKMGILFYPLTKRFKKILNKINFN
ncbi:MAG TPA: glycosyltransferase family 2 protein [Ignavibacteria bacterium]|nr:glycosyltransferase family 2 protein [Ignavibacteria bacterium]